MMSVWPGRLPAVASLLGSEGELVSVSIKVDPRCLESLLDALAHLSFPINPQLNHDGAAAPGAEGGRATVVEFPAYASRLAEVRDALKTSGFGVAGLAVTGMLDEIQRTGGASGEAARGAGAH
jgi:hypothetical protein